MAVGPFLVEAIWVLRINEHLCACRKQRLGCKAERDPGNLGAAGL